MSSKSMELFPDLHHKMSKKIAQLTKVIYHLNTKNEDHANEIETIAQNHQLEIQQILKDAANRIGKFKEIVETKQANMNQDVKLEKLQKKHDLEKKAAMEEFTNYKLKIGEREQKISNEFQKKFDNLLKEVESVNQKFQDRIQQFESSNSKLKLSLEQANKTNSMELDSMKKKYEKEISDLVTTNNEKYQQMLLQQLQLRETLQNELENKLKSELLKSKEKYELDMKQEIGQIRAQLNGDKQEALMNLRRELEEKMSQQKTDMITKLDKLTSELKGKTEEYQNTMEIKENVIVELKKELNKFQQSMHDQLGGKEASLANITKDLGQAREQIIQFQAKLNQKDEELDALRKIIENKNKDIIRFVEDIAMKTQEIQQLMLQLQSIHELGNNTQKDLLHRLQIAEMESESYRNEINQMANNLNNLREEIKNQEKSAGKSSKDMENMMLSLQNEKKILQKRLDELLLSTSVASDQATSELSTLHKKFLDREKFLLQENEQLQHNHLLSLEKLKNLQLEESESFQKAKKNLMESFELKENQLRHELSVQKELSEKEILSCKTEHQNQLDVVNEKHRVELDNYKISCNELENKLQSISEQAEIDKAQSASEIQKLDLKYKNTQKELDAKKKESERAESVCNSLKNQIESLREELKASQKAFLDKMDISQQKLEADWQMKLKMQADLHEKLLQEVTMEAQKKLEFEINELNKRHDEEINALKSLLNKEAMNSANELARTEQDRLDLESKLKVERNERSIKVSELNTKYSNDMKNLEDLKNRELDKLKKEMQMTNELKVNVLQSSHQLEMDQLQMLMKTMEKEAAQQLMMALEEQKISNQKNLENSLNELKNQLNNEKLKSLDELEKKTGDEMTAYQLCMTREKSLLNQEIIELKNNKKENFDQINGLQKMLLDERNERQRREEIFILEKSQLQREHETDLRKEKELSERKIIEIVDRTNGDLKLMKDEQVNVRLKFEERFREIHDQYKILEEKYKNRESRSEDLMKIEELQREVIEKEELVQQTKAEMMYFKREMLNREENYNKKFNSSPNVGVMQVIKPKEVNENPGGPLRAKPTVMRVMNTNGGAVPGVNSMMAGLGGALGGGGLESSSLKSSSNGTGVGKTGGGISGTIPNALGPAGPIPRTKSK